MRLYEFKNQAGTIDVTVVTDGLGEQKRIFITETPRGISVPGDMTPTPPNLNNDILKMGFDFVAGTERDHLDFVRFALQNDLQLIQWNEGLNELSPVMAVEGYTSVLKTYPTLVELAKNGLTTQPMNITSTRTPWGGTAENVPFSAEITEGAGHFHYNTATNTISAEANPTDSDIYGKLVLTQAYSEKQFIVILKSKGA